MNGLQSIVKIMCWFNPFVWLAWRKARHHCEMVVDETVAAAYNNYSKESYEQTILTLAEKGSIQPLPAMVGIIEPRTFMFRRISRLLDAASIKVGRGRSIVNWCLLAIFAISFIPMGMTQPKEAVLEKRPFPEVLNEMQIQYVNWTNERFKGSFEGSQYANLSDSTKTEMEEIWLATLEEEESQKYRSAMSALVAIRSKRAIKPLLRIAAERREKNNSYRWIAVRALGIIGDDSVVPELIHLIYHYNQNTRIWAQISLARLTGVNFGYDWQKWGEWWNKQEKTPKFSPTMITWTTKYVEYADPKKQKQGDMKAFGRPKTKPNR